MSGRLHPMVLHGGGMLSLRLPGRDPRRAVPRGRGWVMALAALIFGAILVARLRIEGAADAVGMFCCVPVALLALAYGIRGGAVGTAIGMGFLELWGSFADAPMSFVGWAARSVPLLLVGVLLGAVIDRLRRTDHERLRLLDASARHREAVEINDTLVQQVSAAKWSLESGNAAHALTILSDTVELGHRLVSDHARESNLGHVWTGSPRDQWSGR
jgi:glucose-6-phosphate-specific signal transduction histidine kinase